MAAGNRRAKVEGLTNCHFQEGDACDLTDLEDDAFNLTVSVFGAMFAPRPDDVAREMVRVTRPGGRIVMGNWIPGDPTLVAQILRISSTYSPPPPAGFVSPMTWGVKDTVTERFAAAGVDPERVTCTEETFTFRHDGSPADFVNVFRSYYGPSMTAFDAAGSAGRAADLLRGLEDLFAEQNTSSTPGSTVIPATYLRVVAEL